MGGRPGGGNRGYVFERKTLLGTSLLRLTSRSLGERPHDDGVSLARGGRQSKSARLEKDVDHVGRVHEGLEADLPSGGVGLTRLVDLPAAVAHHVRRRVDLVSEATDDQGVELGMSRRQDVQPDHLRLGKRGVASHQDQHG